MPVLSDVALITPGNSNGEFENLKRAIHIYFHQYADHSIYCTRTLTNFTFQVSVDAVFQQLELFYYIMLHAQSVIHLAIHHKFLKPHLSHIGDIDTAATTIHIRHSKEGHQDFPFGQ